MRAEEIFLEFSASKLEQQAGRIAACLDRLSDDQVWARGGDNENAIGNLVLHLCGNVRQWIGTGLGGRPDVRVREREFAARGGASRDELKERLAGVAGEASETMRALAPQRLVERATIQGYEVSLLEAIYHVVEHFSGHAGQIIFATKLLTGGDLEFYRHLSDPGHKQQVP
jgi:uncharacterized damage-inducible protein DinB